MKVVLFCGGMGMRLRDYSDRIPKPLVEIGPRPVLWHLMRYYAHYGHTEFILCLGHGALAIKEFFLNYREWATNDFVIPGGGHDISMLGTDIEDWRITFVDTGIHSTIGERLRRVRPHLGDDEAFLANYSDGLTDLDLNAYVDGFLASDDVARMLSVKAPHTFHIIHSDPDNRVTELEYAGESPMRVNAGFFALRREIFNVLEPGEDLVLEPFQRLMKDRKLRAIPFDGFWKNMDTFKDKVELEAMYNAGNPPWQVWNSSNAS
ncbi:MAG: glucose-1-phosphate cytidylyltransferase [Actinomycetales bacterium]|nr:MAG: glucose-1-phosphate cytidylyltransferase [Actinomycetales bacterium]